MHVIMESYRIPMIMRMIMSIIYACYYEFLQDSYDYACEYAYDYECHYGIL